MTARTRFAFALGPLFAAPAALAHEAAASGGGAEMLLLGTAVVMLGLRRLRSGARTRLLRHLRDGI